MRGCQLRVLPPSTSTRVPSARSGRLTPCGPIASSRTAPPPASSVTCCSAIRAAGIRSPRSGGPRAPSSGVLWQRPPRVGRPAHRRVRRRRRRRSAASPAAPCALPRRLRRPDRRRHLGRGRRHVAGPRGARHRGRAGGRGRRRGARERLPHLCGRDPQALDADGIARAVVESVAENTSDAVVGALVWGAVAGVPGLVAFRAVNTLDAMVGPQVAQRYRRFGWASARLDDVAGWPGARLTARARGASPGRPSARRACGPGAPTRGRHPSPNAGPWRPRSRARSGCGSAAPCPTRGRVEHRPVLNGAGPAVRGRRHRAGRAALAARRPGWRSACASPGGLC